MADPNPTRRLIYRGLKIDLALQRVALRDGTTAEPRSHHPSWGGRARAHG